MINQYGLRKEQIDELIFSTKEVKLNKVLDLTDPEVLTSLGIDRRDLLLDRTEIGGAYDMTQIIGNIANKYGFDGIIAPSAQTSGTNLIIFERALQ